MSHTPRTIDRNHQTVDINSKTNAFTIGGAQSLREICYPLRFSNASDIYYAYFSGKVDGRNESLQRLDEQKLESVLGSDLDDGSIEIFIAEHCTAYRKSISLTYEDLSAVILRRRVPLLFAQLITENNGCTTAYCTTNAGQPESFQLFVKLPKGPFLTASFYWRYCFKTRKTLFIYFGTRVPDLIERLENVLSTRETTAPGVNIINPFKFLSLVYDEHSITLETHRNKLDIVVQQLEGRTGTNTAHVFSPAVRSNNYYEQIEALHRNRSYMEFFEHSAKFHIGLGNFLCQQYKIVVETNDILGPQFTTEDTAWEVPSHLALILNLAQGRLWQMEVLLKRNQAQTNVVYNLISQQDSRVNIQIAEESKRIALESARIAAEAKIDSTAMKTIAALTMFFLPATFVATLFSMVFFNETSDGSGTYMVVGRDWWMYLAVTLPLTALVIFIWLGSYYYLMKDAEKERRRQ